MTVLRPTAIDAAPRRGRNIVEDGREQLSWVPRGMRTCSQGKKVAYGHCGQGDRDEGVLRSHQINRGLRRRGQPEPDRPRHAARTIGDFAASRGWHDRYLHHAHATSRLRSCRSVRRLRRWVVTCTTDRSTPEPSSVGWDLSNLAIASAMLPPCTQSPHHRLTGTEDNPRFRNWLGDGVHRRVPTGRHVFHSKNRRICAAISAEQFRPSRIREHEPSPKKLRSWSIRPLPAWRSPAAEGHADR